jgi:hypothetical protein
MKTKVVMKSPDRELFGVVIRQNTDGFLNLSDLQKAYNSEAIKEFWPTRRIESVLSAENNYPRMYYALYEGGFIKTSLLAFMEMVDKQGITKTLKTLGVYKTLGGRENKSAWCNPVLFVLISLEINPKIYGKTIYWIADKLIINRIEAGNLYKSLTNSIKKFNPTGEQYMTLAKALNHITFGRHEAGIRNTGTTKQLKDLELLETKMAFAIDMGYIKSFDMLITELRKIYNKKWNHSNKMLTSKN